MTILHKGLCYGKEHRGVTNLSSLESAKQCPFFLPAHLPSTKGQLSRLRYQYHASGDNCQGEVAGARPWLDTSTTRSVFYASIATIPPTTTANAPATGAERPVADPVGAALAALEEAAAAAPEPRVAEVAAVPEAAAEDELTSRVAVLTADVDTAGTDLS